MSSKDARAELKAARENLAKVSRKSNKETDEYIKANKRVVRAEQNVPWHQR